MRRLVVLVAALATVVAVPGTAWAARGDINVAGDGPVSEPTDVTVRVTPQVATTDCDGVLLGNILGGTLEEICQVTIAAQRPRRSGADQVRSEPTELECRGDCRGGEVVFGPMELDPTGAAPFEGIPEAERCNGRWTLQAQIEGSGSDDSPTTGITVSAPPVAPSNVSVETGSSDARVSWQPTPQGDITGYRVERRAGGGWEHAGTVGGGASSYTDANAPSGEVSYRVTALRADGFVTRPDGDGGTQRVAIGRCGEDDGRDLSSSDHPDEANRYGTASGQIATSGSPGDGGSGGGSSDGGDGSGGGGALGDGALGGSSSSGGGGGSGGNGDGNGGGDGASEEETGPPAYGEGLGFSEELDFGNVESVPDNEVVVEENLATRGIERYLDPERIAIPVALGLILIVLGAHLRAWMNTVLPEEAGGERDDAAAGPGGPVGDGSSGWWPGG